MATGVETKVYEALMAHLRALSSIPASQIAWPNVRFAPSRTWFIRPAILPAEASALTVAAAGGTNQLSGVFSVDVFWPEDNEGLTDAFEKASAIIAHFARGTRIDREGITVQIVSPPSVAAPLQEPGWAQIPVSIRYIAFTASP